MFITMVTFKGFNVKQLGVELISMGCNGSSVFRGARASVTTQMKENVAPFLMGVHYFVHWTNLAMLVLSKLSLVVQLEVFLHILYGFLFHSPKKFPEFQSLCDVFIKKKDKLLETTTLYHQVIQYALLVCFFQYLFPDGILTH